MSKACVFFTAGYEEVEALAVVDLLRRAEIETQMVSVTGDMEVIGSHNIPVRMDKLIEEVDFSTLDVLVLPGGPGTNRLEECELLMQQIDSFVKQEKLVCAICAAPSILGHRGHLKGRRAISYPDFESHLEGADIVRQPSVTDGNIITGRGMGCAIEFGLAIVEYLKGKQARDFLADKIILMEKAL